MWCVLGIGVVLTIHGFELKAETSSKLFYSTGPCGTGRVWIQAVVAACLAVKASVPIDLYRPLTLRVPHAVSVLLLQHKHPYMSPARHLSCMTVLLSQPHSTTEHLNLRTRLLYTLKEYWRLHRVTLLMFNPYLLAIYLFYGIEIYTRLRGVY